MEVPMGWRVGALLYVKKSNRYCMQNAEVQELAHRL